jgi:AcrR family transcriptional regulator
MEQKSSGRRRGRPPAFDRDQVVEKAQALFWREGASGVSLDQLSGATGLHKPSLYAAFGGKPGLYLAALDAYIERGAPDVSGVLSVRPLADALRAFFEADLEVFCGSAEPRGCFLIGTAIEAAGESHEVAQRVSSVFAALRRILRARLEAAVAEDDLPGETDVDGLLEIVFATHVALAVAARSGCSRDELRERYERVAGLFESFVPASKPGS